MIVEFEKPKSKFLMEFGKICTQTLVVGCCIYLNKLLFLCLEGDSRNNYIKFCHSPLDSPACFSFFAKKCPVDALDAGINKIGGVFSLALIFVLTTNYGSLAYRKIKDLKNPNEHSLHFH